MRANSSVKRPFDETVDLDFPLDFLNRKAAGKRTPPKSGGNPPTLSIIFILYKY